MKRKIKKTEKLTLNDGDEERRSQANHEGNTKKPIFPTAMHANEK